jgi:adenylate cyclase
MRRTQDRLAMLPRRVQDAIAEQNARAEVLIAAVQVGIVLVFLGVYAIAPKSFPPDVTFQPVPWILAAYLAVTSARLALALARRLPEWLLAAGVVVDMALLLLLIFSFHIQYMQPPGFYLKAPTLLAVFIFIALRALRFESRYVLLAGAVAALGWAGLALYAVLAPGHGLTRDFARYIMSSDVLIGAEVEKILMICLVTAILAIAIVRGQRLLIGSVADSIAARDLSRFFAPEIAERIRHAEQPLMAGEGEAREAAILSVDIRGFTPLSTELAPAALMQLLADYQARLVPVIQAQGGSIDKFLGDGILASFGCARPSQTHAADALAAVDGLIAALDRWNEERREAGERTIEVNCAVSSGRVIFGAVGDATRLEYTVIGDPVNLAAKLEKQNKEERARALCDAETWELALRQGYVPARQRERRAGRHVAGVKDPLDLVVLA